MKMPSAPPMPIAVPRRRCTHGATTTDVSASSRPQPKKTQPTPWASIFSGKGVKASRVKNPKL